MWIFRLPCYFVQGLPVMSLSILPSDHGTIGHFMACPGNEIWIQKVLALQAKQGGEILSFSAGWKRVQTYSNKHELNIQTFACLYLNIQLQHVCGCICSSLKTGVALPYQYYCIHTHCVDLRLSAHLKKAAVSISQSFKTLRFFAFLPETGADFGEAFHL